MYRHFKVKFRLRRFSSSPHPAPSLPPPTSRLIYPFFFQTLKTKSQKVIIWRKRAVFVFRCVRQERISIRGSVRPSVRWTIRPSVGPLRLCKNRVSWLFLATVRPYTETNDQPTCFESLFTRLFVHLSLHTYVIWSTHAETQPGRIVAQSGLFFYGLFSYLFLFSPTF